MIVKQLISYPAASIGELDSQWNGAYLSLKYTPAKEVACAVRTSLYKNRIIYSLESCA